MKTMTCKQLGGSCDKTFSADTFKHIVILAKDHRIEMFKAKDKKHLLADEKMNLILKEPKDALQWIREKHKQFDELKEE